MVVAAVEGPMAQAGEDLTKLDEALTSIKVIEAQIK